LSFFFSFSFILLTIFLFCFSLPAKLLMQQYVYLLHEGANGLTQLMHGAAPNLRLWNYPCASPSVCKTVGLKAL
jgi:hypothetical protein